MKDGNAKWWIAAIGIPVLGILVTVVLYSANKRDSEELRQRPLNAGTASWNIDNKAYDIPLDNNSTTIRRGFRATFKARPIRLLPTGEGVSVDQVVFSPRDRIADYTWQKRITNISIPANASSTINAHIVDPKLAGTFLEGDLTIEFAAEEKLQPVRYHLNLTVLESMSNVPE